MNESICPLCSTKRVGAFRYCRTCRLDFDELAVLTIAARPDPETSPGPQLMPSMEFKAWLTATGSPRAAMRWTSPTAAREPLPDGW